MGVENDTIWRRIGPRVKSLFAAGGASCGWRSLGGSECEFFLWDMPTFHGPPCGQLNGRGEGEPPLH